MEEESGEEEEESLEEDGVEVRRWARGRPWNTSVTELSCSLPGCMWLCAWRGFPLVTGVTLSFFPLTCGSAATEAAPAPAPAGGNRRVYVGNLSWNTAWQGLKDHMKQAGEGESRTQSCRYARVPLLKRPTLRCPWCSHPR